MQRHVGFIRASVGVLTLALASVAWAHVFWVQASSSTPSVGERVSVQLRVGDAFPGDVVPRNNSKIEKCVVVRPDGTQASLGGRDADPVVAKFSPEAPGGYLVAYRSKPSSVELEGEKFTAYLHDKGLDRILARREKEGRSSAPAKEIFSRAAKYALATRESGPHDGVTKPVGLRCEIVPVSNPVLLTPGSELAVVVLFEGKPLANALVDARTAADQHVKLQTRTNERGEAKFVLPVAGLWVVDTVEMVDAPKDSGAEWESIWASLAFELVAGPAKAVQGPGGREASR